MTAGSDSKVSLSDLGTAQLNHVLGLEPDASLAHPRIFKKHKVLPHPRRDDALRNGWGNEATPPRNNALPGPVKPGRLRAVRPARGPEPPPTPPGHSRTSSSTSQPSDPSPPGRSGTCPDSADSVGPQPPVTPAHHQTPPTPNLTPDRTPPGRAAGQPPRRPPLASRNVSRMTTDSRDESFQTARESPSSSVDGDRDEKSTLRPDPPSAKTSQSDVRQLPRGTRSVSQPVGLGLQLEPSPFDDSPARVETSAKPAKEADWDPSRMKNVTMRKRHPSRSNDPKVVDDRPVTPTNATRAVRRMSVDESPIIYSARRIAAERFPTRAVPEGTGSSSSVDVKRSSILSTRSNASTVVEAAVMLEPGTPQRRKTLRHVRKQSALREVNTGAESPAPAHDPPAPGPAHRQEPSSPRANDACRASITSTATTNSIASRKARRSVWQNGGVPVVVVPQRRSSIKSVRSTSSRRSRSTSSMPTFKENVPQFDRPRRRSRAYSEPDGSQPGDERTMDFPPVIPARSSSLSAPTSRNVSRNASRSGSLTAESLRAHNLLQAQQAHQALMKASQELEKFAQQRQQDKSDTDRLQFGPELRNEPRSSQAIVRPEPARERRDEPRRGSEHMRDSLGVDEDEDRLGQRLSVQNTPYSVASVETGTSHAEVSEAMAVNIYPHQSKSVVLVDHPAKTSETSSSTVAPPVPPKPVPSAKVPATPPQQFSVFDVDSPLRNPRAPPIPPIPPVPPVPPNPPAINFIPATPSGLTPSVEKKKQLGNYFEMTQKPKRSLSLLRRALTGRRSSRDPSPSRFLGRSLSLMQGRSERAKPKRRSTIDTPADESKLHPHWRPAYAEEEHCCCCEGCPEDECFAEQDRDRESSDEDRTYRYPPIDNRPSPPRRRLSERIKRTFAILPARDDEFEDFPATSDDGPDRRTIRRTPSGNLRVIKRRLSMESLTREARPVDPPPYAAPPGAVNGVERGRTRIWRSLSLKARSSFRRSKSVPTRATPVSSSSFAAARGGSGGDERGSGAAATGFLPSLGDKINLPRRLSERRRERRTQELRSKISGPKEVRDGVGDVIRRNSWQTQLQTQQSQKELQRRRMQQMQKELAERRMESNGTPDEDALYVWEQQRERARMRRQGRH